MMHTRLGAISKGTSAGWLTVADDWLQVFVHTIRTALTQVNPQVPFVDSSPSNQIKALDPYAKRCPSFSPPVPATVLVCSTIVKPVS